MKSIINLFNLNSKSIFLMDGLGAGLTTILLVVVLKRHNEYFGMPQDILTILSILALILSIYSFSCFAFSKSNLSKLLKIIIVANLIYCFLTLNLVIYFSNQLTIFGLLYFVGEILIICSLVMIELKILKTSGQSKRDSSEIK